MQDLHSPYQHDVVWPRERICQASIAAATEDRRWEGRRIIGWSECTDGYGKRQAIMALSDGTRYLIHEQGTVL